MFDFNVKKYYGDSLELTINLVDSDGAAIVITGFGVVLTLGDIDESTSGVVITNGGSTGQIDIFVPKAVMATLTDARYTFSVGLTWGDDYELTIFQALIEIQEAVV